MHSHNGDIDDILIRDMVKTLKKLTLAEISKRLKKHDTWTLNTKSSEISKVFLFPNFVHGLSFVAKVTVHAEIQNHHPDIELSYGKVKVKLSTHEAKGLTNADFQLAEKIDSILT